MPPVLDRRVQYDSRSRGFPIRALIGLQHRRSYTWKVPVLLNQGTQGACVGFAWAAELAARPVTIPGVTDDVARGIYRRAQQLDDFPDDEPGTSVLAGAKAVMESGRLTEYRWAFGEDDLGLAVGWRGPAVLGTWWWSGMWEPDEKGFIWPTGHREGGHAYLAFRYSASADPRTGRPADAYAVHNSWGAWGNDGRGWAWVHREAMKFLLEDEGEACVPVRRAVGP